MFGAIIGAVVGRIAHEGQGEADRRSIARYSAMFGNEIEVQEKLRSYYKPVKKDCQGCGAPSSVGHSCEYCGRAS